MQTSVVNYKELNFDLRIDAEYYRAEVLDKIHRLDKIKHDVLENLASFVVGPFGSTVTVDQYVSKSDYRYVRNKDINDFVISDDEPALVPEDVYNRLPQFHIKENDLLITVVGTLGKVGIAQAKDSKSIFSCKSTLIRPKGIDPFYLLSYLNSKTGQIFALRGIRGVIQQGLNLSDLKEIKVFIPSKEFQSCIKQVVCESFNLIKKANNDYSQAEQILLSELNLLNWKPKRCLSFVKHYSDTESADRIDAEYFQPMYEEVMTRFKDNAKCEVLENITDLIGHPSNPPYTSEESQDKTFIITQKHLGNYFPNDNFWEDLKALYTTSDFIKKNTKFLLQKDDLILYSVGAYIGKTNIYNLDVPATIGSFLTLIRPNKAKINPYYLLVYLNSDFGKRLTRRCSRGMAQQYVYPFDIKEVIIPIIPIKKQENIEKIMLDSLSAKQHSKLLLDIAKRGVELAIEKDEKQARKWIDLELNKQAIVQKK